MEQKTKDLAFGDVPKLIKELQQRNADLTLQAKTCRVLLLSLGFTVEEFRSARADIDSMRYDEATLAKRARQRSKVRGLRS